MRPLASTAVLTRETFGAGTEDMRHSATPSKKGRQTHTPEKRARESSRIFAPNRARTRLADSALQDCDIRRSREVPAKALRWVVMP